MKCLITLKLLLGDGLAGDIPRRSALKLKRFVSHSAQFLLSHRYSTYGSRTGARPRFFFSSAVIPLSWIHLSILSVRYVSPDCPAYHLTRCRLHFSLYHAESSGSHIGHISLALIKISSRVASRIIEYRHVRLFHSTPNSSSDEIVFLRVNGYRNGNRRT